MLVKILLLSHLAYCCYARNLDALERLIVNALGEKIGEIDFCAGKTGYIDDPRRCDGFLICVNGLTYEMTCPNNLKYDPVNKLCSSERCGSNFYCHGLPEGDYALTDPSTFKVAHLKRYSWDCSKFVTCANGMAYLRTCPGEGEYTPLDQQHFSLLTNKCELTADASCNEVSTGSYSTEICIDNFRVYVVGEDWRGDKKTCYCKREINRPRTYIDCVPDEPITTV